MTNQIDYQGTLIHYLITTINLVYAIGLLLALGGDLYTPTDSNHITPYALLTFV